MDRRTLLKLGGMGLVAAGLGGCAARSAPTPTVTRRPPLRLAPVRAEWDRIIRTTVGLRPHRPSGFVLRADKLDDTTVIHNYGHGGSGMSLSWGTGRMAAEMALGHDSRRAAVIGCGAVGLTAARQLQRRGFAVTIYAMSVPPNTTSNMSFAGVHPHRGAGRDELRTSCLGRPVPRSGRDLLPRAAVAGGDEIRRVLDRPLRAQRHAPGRRRGRCRGGAGAAASRPPALRPAHAGDPGSIPFPSRATPSRGSQLRIEPSIYLDALVHDFIDFGGRIEIRKFTEPRELVELSEALVVNCSGLGARDLFGDDDLLPAKGQLTVLVPQRGGRLGHQAATLPTGIPAGSSASTCSHAATASFWAARRSGASGRGNRIRRRCSAS